MQIQLVKGLMIDWNKIDRNSYLRDIDVLRDLDHMYFNHSVTFFAGENGSGKSTWFNIILDLMDSIYWMNQKLLYQPETINTLGRNT